MRDAACVGGSASRVRPACVLRGGRKQAEEGGVMEAHLRVLLEDRKVHVGEGADEAAAPVEVDVHPGRLGVEGGGRERRLRARLVVRHPAREERRHFGVLWFRRVVRGGSSERVSGRSGVRRGQQRTCERQI